MIAHTQPPTSQPARSVPEPVLARNGGASTPTRARGIRSARLRRRLLYLLLALAALVLLALALRPTPLEVEIGVVGRGP
jgi:hypothetical protein